MAKTTDSRQLALISDGIQVERVPKLHSASTFADNLSLPIHRWFRYSAGFSALWVRNLISQEKLEGRSTVLDPFAGSGTVLIEGETCGIESVGLEPHPFVARVAKAKLAWGEEPIAFKDYALSLLEDAQRTPGSGERYPKLIQKCFPSEVLARLDSIRTAWEQRTNSSRIHELSWLALISIIRECSPVGTAQWQYVLPNKSKANPLDPYKAFYSKILLMCADMIGRQRSELGPTAKVIKGDARDCNEVPDGWADLVITSPPYANNYDYADATRLEMSFLGEIRGWGDLQEAVRRHLIRSCSQHVARLNGEGQAMIGNSLLYPIRQEIEEVYRSLSLERDKHGGKKPYHLMIAAYFEDMARSWVALRRVTSADSLVAMVIGDSAPYGVHVPVEKWLGELALSAGFKTFHFEKLRDRNTKWKNRKHRVPLHEGILWVRG